MIQDKFFAYLCSYKSPKGVTMTGNNNVYKTKSKNGNKEYNEKYICCFFTIWNLKSAVTYNCGRVVLFLTSVYFAISKLMLLFSYFSTDHIWEKWVIFFFKAQKYFFAVFNLLKMVIYTTLFRRWSTLWNSTLKITALFRRCLTL